MAKQLTLQGVIHAERLGAILRGHYIDKHGLVAPGCPPGDIGLECDQAQKNQITTQVAIGRSWSVITKPCV
jgi:hypothetical protein